MKTIKTPLERWEKETNNLTKHFVEKYFPECDYYWIGNQIGGVMDIADLCIDFSTIVEALRLDVSPDDLIGYYNYKLDFYEKKHSGELEEGPVNMKYWIYNHNKQ